MVWKYYTFGLGDILGWVQLFFKQINNLDLEGTSRWGGGLI